MKKKFLSVLACVAIVLVGGSMLVACGSTATEPVRLSSQSIQFGNETAFSNNDSLKIEKTDEHTYNISGTASFMTEDQAEAFWSGTAASGDAYVVLEFDYSLGTTISYTDVTGEKSYTNTDDSEDETLYLIVRVSGTSSSGTQSRTFTITEDGQTEGTAYTITFNNLTTTQAE